MDRKNLTALLGILAMRGFQNRDKIGGYSKSSRRRHTASTIRRTAADIRCTAHRNAIAVIGRRPGRLLADCGRRPW